MSHHPLQNLDRFVEFQNFKSAASAVVSNTVFASMVKLAAKFGPVIFNGQAVRYPAGGYYDGSNPSNDADCLNKCRGRGQIPPAATTCASFSVRPFFA